MFWMLAGELITVGVNWWATHSGGPMQGAMLLLLAAMHW
jgi:hypothetical protein